ncbi:MAG: hypothetical protein Q4G26_05395, partial [Paracoccus sp. (in: a-proteobacteria)]|nr:hypothetical protein [Paracoccus sp. (in: a-proteobacteria)]
TPATPATPAAAPAPRPPAAGLQGGGQTVAQLDRSTPAERAAATAAPAATGGKLGDTIASLGNATEPGFWIKTPLVTSAAKGRVVNPATGKSVNLDLQPLGGGGGSQLSLAAMQALGVGLTDLPKVEVWRN